jgi:hypothetical protein
MHYSLNLLGKHLIAQNRIFGIKGIGTTRNHLLASSSFVDPVLGSRNAFSLLNSVAIKNQSQVIHRAG